MASTYYFIAEPGTHDIVEWFRGQPEVAEEYPKEGGFVLYFSQFGRLKPDSAGGFDLTQSPVVSIIEPRIRRGILWTVGEVHFLAKNTPTTYPDLEQVRRRFERWLQHLPVAWEYDRSAEPGHGYYFEGGIQNVANKIYAFASGVQALEEERYFVAEGAHDEVLNKLCRTLRLRGITCS